MKRNAWVLFLAIGTVSLASAGVIDEVKQAQGQMAPAQQAWSAWGGQAGVRWNGDLLADYGITLQKPAGQTTESDTRHHQWFDLHQGPALQFMVQNHALIGFTGGSVQMQGGFVLNLRDGSTIDLRNLAIRAHSGNPRVLDLVSSDGKAWFYSDHLMLRPLDNDHTLQIETADIRISPELADRLAAPEINGWSFADLAMLTHVYIQGSDQPEDACDQSSPTYPWPGHAVTGVNGATYQADLFMQTFDAQFMRCQGCDGTGGTDGLVVFAPDSSLINNVNNGTAVATVPGDPLGTSTALYAGNIAWNEMFSGSPPNYNFPYKNDQHPFLIWNMYRFNPDGSLEQIGRSGVKHAFLTENFNCLGTCYDFNSNGRGCQDEYATGNNDDEFSLGPRSEIVPAIGIWGRCGSVWDPNCTGNEQDPNNGSYGSRLTTHESQIDPAANSGATYKFETWYLARDDINIYNSMATLSVTPHYNSSGHNWSLNNQTGYRLGPAIDRWVDPTNPPVNSSNTELATTEGHVKVAVKATDLGNGSFRYDYAVMNLDYARAVIQSQLSGSGPDPRVVSNKGFDSFSVPIPAGATVGAMTFRNGTTDHTQDWYVATTGGQVTWSSHAAPLIPPPVSGGPRPSRPTLDWGTMYAFSITVNAPPGNGNTTLHVAQSGSPASFVVAGVVPAVQ